jgi:hypothetical protein
MSRDAYIVRECGVVVFWARKAGNTSLAEWLFSAAPSFRGQSPDRINVSQTMRHSELAADHEAALAAIRNEGFRDFVLARDPYGRIVSAYLEKFCYMGEPISRFDQLVPFARRVFLEIMAKKGRSGRAEDYADFYPGISFNDLLAYVRDGHKDLKRSGEPRLNAHLSTQVPFAFDGRHSYGTIVRLENIANDIRSLAEALGTSVPFPHARRNDVTLRRQDTGDLSDATSVEMIAAGIVPGRGALLNDRTRPIVREIYDIDFRLLGYV